jgi:hypothetical protein
VYKFVQLNFSAAIRICLCQNFLPHLVLGQVLPNHLLYLLNIDCPTAVLVKRTKGVCEVLLSVQLVLVNRCHNELVELNKPTVVSIHGRYNLVDFLFANRLTKHIIPASKQLLSGQASVLVCIELNKGSGELLAIVLTCVLGGDHHRDSLLELGPELEVL